MRHFKIVDYKLENFMFVRELTLSPEGNLVMFTGNNATGKGSSMKGVPFLLGGAKFEPEKPGRDGGKYFASITLEDRTDPLRLIATRTKTGGLQLKVEPPNKRWDTDQNMLDSILNKLGFNPMRFIHAGFDEQREMLKRARILEEDFTALEERIKIIRKTERPAANKRRGELWAQAIGIVIQPDLPKERIDIDAIKARLKTIKEYNRTVEQRVIERAALGVILGNAERERDENAAFIERMSNEIGGMEAEIKAREPQAGEAAQIRDALDTLVDRSRRLLNSSELSFTIEQAHTRATRYISEASESVASLRKQLEQKRKALRAAEEQAGRLNEELAQAQLAVEQAPAADRQDDESVEQELETAEKINREIDRRTRREALDAEAIAADAEWAALGEEMEKAQERIDAAYRNAQMPMKGMTFTEEGARLNGILLEDVNGAQQIEIGMRVALAGNPQLRLVMIDNGDALDSDSKLKVAKLAQELDCELWMSSVNFSEEDEEAIAAASPVTTARMEEGRARKISKRRPAASREGQ